MKSSDVLWRLAVSVMVYSFIGSVKNLQSCPPPDVPAEGKYLPRNKTFLHADQVTYSCNDGFALLGKEVRTCKSNGAWSDQTPFCDRPAKLKNPRASNGYWSTLSYMIDNNTNTCFKWERSTSHTLQVYIDEQVVVQAVMIFLERGTTKIKISSGMDNDMKDCNEYDRLLEKSQWVLIKCRNSKLLANSIKIMADKTNNVTICEIQVYVKDEYGCEEAPDRRIANGFFEVNRNMANLHCEDGFTAVNSRLACEYNSWMGDGPRCEENLCDPFVYNSSLDPGAHWTFLDEVRKISPGTRRQLICKPGYQIVGSPDKVVCGRDGMWTKTNATCKEQKKPNTKTIIIVVVGTVVVLVILLLLGVAIYLIKTQRNREVVVVFKPSTDGSMTSGADSEYTTGHYESIPSAAPIPPTSPRPSPLPPVLTDGYALAEDFNKTLMKQSPTAADIAFGTLKKSDLYGK